MGPRTDRTTRLATRWAVAAALTLTLGALCLLASQVSAGPFQDGKADPPKKDEPAKPAAPKLGLIANEAKAFQGYTLLAPMQSKTAYLMDMQGRVVNKWETNCTPGVSTYLLESGHLLRPGSLGGEEMSFGGGPAAGGRVQEFA